MVPTWHGHHIESKRPAVWLSWWHTATCGKLRGGSGVCTTENRGKKEHRVAKGKSQCWEVGRGVAEEGSTHPPTKAGSSRSLGHSQKPRGKGSSAPWSGTRVLDCPHAARLQVPPLPHTTYMTLELLRLCMLQFPYLPNEDDDNNITDLIKFL